MPRFEPFRGIRYDLDRFRIGDVTAPPYDVIDAHDRASLVARSPRNAVVVDLPDEADGAHRYATAAETFAEWRRDGVLVDDDRPAFTVYRMAYTDDLGRAAQTLGVIGALALSRAEDGQVLPHEHTTPKAKSDRLDLLRSTRANLSAVWGLSLTEGLSDLLGAPEAPLADWTDDAGVEHTCWRVDDGDRVGAIRQAVGATPVVIADGHHRYATCLSYSDERLAADGGPGPAGATMTYVVELIEDQLSVRPIHRLLSGLGSRDVTTLLAPWFDLGPTVTPDASVLRRMESEASLAVVSPDGAAQLLQPRAGAFAGVASLDSSRLAHALEGQSQVEMIYQHGVEQVVRAVTDGHAQAGVLLRPATVGQIAANARAGARMPPKTTFFHPKPKTGIVFRALE
ncbi:MAG: DUF1015 domain-containing protein [Acidimicrobiales bacterium]